MRKSDILQRYRRVFVIMFESALCTRSVKANDASGEHAMFLTLAVPLKSTESDSAWKQLLQLHRLNIVSLSPYSLTTARHRPLVARKSNCCNSPHNWFSLPLLVRAVWWPPVQSCSYGYQALCPVKGTFRIKALHGFVHYYITELHFLKLSPTLLLR